MNPPPYKVNVIGKKNNAFVWDPEVVLVLRKNYRILGSLVGSLPRFPLQNQFLGLPLKLMPEEVTLLLSKGIIILVDETKSYCKPTPEQIEEFENDKLKNEDQQLQRFYPKINIKTSSKSLKWYNDDDHKTKTLESAKQSKIWTWPETSQEEYKYKIYCDLWNKGYFISNGLKFGGDYLLYPGDPFRFHGHFIALVMETNKSITSLDIITFGRLATNVKKSFMVCGWDEKEQKSIYHCIEWSGFG